MRISKAVSISTFAAAVLLSLPAQAQSADLSANATSDTFCVIERRDPETREITHYVTQVAPYYGQNAFGSAGQNDAYFLRVKVQKYLEVNFQVAMTETNDRSGCDYSHHFSGSDPRYLGEYASSFGGAAKVIQLELPEGWSRPDWNPEASSGDLATETQRWPLEFKSVEFARQADQQGYRRASIEVAYRFMVCAGEVHFAYSLDRGSLRHSKDYFLASDSVGGNDNIVIPDGEPPVPDTFPLDGRIETISFPVRMIAHVKDAIAGEALGMGCFSGQSKKIGTVAELVGSDATPQAAKAFLETLRLASLANIPFALTHPRPVNPAVRAAREAEERARQERRLAELRTEAERIYRDMMAKGGGGNVNVDPELYPVLQQVIAENTARRDAEYQAQMAAARESDRRHEAEMAAWRASVAENERRQAEWRAEVCRLDKSRCSAD